MIMYTLPLKAFSLQSKHLSRYEFYVELTLRG